jgi:mitochondrial enoyl-[acyl-carrier protein] reductase / trans-2-enoyl-CoA reductase
MRELPLPDQMEEGQVLLELEAVRSRSMSYPRSTATRRPDAPPPSRPPPPLAPPQPPPSPFTQAPINPSDVNTIQGRYPLRPEPPAAVPGHEGVFRVVEVGASSPPSSPSSPPLFRPGDRVVPLRPRLGTWRSRGVFRAEDWHCVPQQLPLEAAAMLCINPPTALGLLEGFVDLFEEEEEEEGRRGGAGGARGAAARAAPAGGAVVAQTGATSAVGQLVVQLARHRGLRTVNLVRPDRPDWEETRAWLEAMGADLVTTDARARRDCGSAGMPAARLALDCVGGSSSAAVARLLAPGGTLVSYGAMSMQPVTVPASLLIFKDVRVRGFWLSGGGGGEGVGGGRQEANNGGGGGEADGSSNNGDAAEHTEAQALARRRATLDRAAALFLEGAWRPPPTERVPLREAAARGVSRAREGKTRTKVLLVPAEE